MRDRVPVVDAQATFHERSLSETAAGRAAWRFEEPVSKSSSYAAILGNTSPVWTNNGKRNVIRPQHHRSFGASLESGAAVSAIALKRPGSVVTPRHRVRRTAAKFCAAVDALQVHRVGRYGNSRLKPR